MRTIDTNGLHVNNPRFSPDGDRIFFWERSGIYVVPLDGSKAPAQVPILGGREPTLSPDGRRIAYTAGRFEPDLALFLARIDGSGPKKLVGGRAWSEKHSGGICRPTFSADGTRILFLFHSSPAPSAPAPVWELWEIRVDGGGARKVSVEVLGVRPSP